MAWKINKNDKNFDISEVDTDRRITWPMDIKHLSEWESIVALANLNFDFQEREKNGSIKRDNCAARD